MEALGSSLRRWLGVGALVALGITASRTGKPSFAGPFSFPGAPAPLINPMPVPDGVESLDYLSSVGGVAFGAVAEPAREGVSIAELRYDGTKADGERLEVLHVDSDEAVWLTAPIYDWQLVPSALFAAGGQHAIFTLFGELEDESETQAARDRDLEILGYHPSFQDTLLGLRMAQADILLLGRAAADLPNIDGEALLAAGEAPRAIADNEAALATVSDLLFGSDGTQIFQSYLITDHQQTVSFDRNGQMLALTGRPYWYLWRFSVDEAELSAIWDEANEAASEELNAEMLDDQAILSPAEWDAKYADEAVNARLVQLVDASVSPQVLQPLPTESEAVSDAIEAEAGVNPVVYESLLTVMRFAALFRYVAAEDGEGYESFLETLPCLPEQGRLYTPSAYDPSDTSLALPVNALPGPSTCLPPSTTTAAGGATAGDEAADSSSSGRDATSDSNSEVSADSAEDGCGCQLGGRAPTRAAWLTLCLLGLMFRRGAAPDPKRSPGRDGRG